MHALDMVSKITPMREVFSTFSTGVRFRTQMDALDVVPKITPSCEVFATVSTGERSLTLVHTPDVMVKITPMWEVFTTNSAGVRLLSQVDALDVSITIAFLLKHFGTDLTDMVIFMETPNNISNMWAPITNSSKVLPTHPTHRGVTLPLRHSTRLYLFH